MLITHNTIHSISDVHLAITHILSNVNEDTVAQLGKLIDLISGWVMVSKEIQAMVDMIEQIMLLVERALD